MNIKKRTFLKLGVFFPYSFFIRRSPYFFVTFECFFPWSMSEDQFFKYRSTWQQMDKTIPITTNFINQKKILFIEPSYQSMKYKKSFLFDSKCSFNLWDMEIMKYIDKYQMENLGFTMKSQFLLI